MKIAFTLAEVLITLGIIGVVAAMTLPSVITNTQNNAKAARIKKIYSVLQQATNKSIYDNGDIKDWYSEAYYSGGFNTSIDLFNKLIKPYYSIAKICNSGSNNSSGYRLCGYKEQNFLALGGNPAIEISLLKIPIVLSDGSILVFRPVKINLSADDSNPVWAYYWDVFYDDNGPKLPNKFGKDVFRFVLDPFHGRVVPSGLYYGISGKELNSYSNIKNECTNQNGTDCAAMIMLDDWKIKY